MLGVGDAPEALLMMKGKLFSASGVLMLGAFRRWITISEGAG